MKIHLLSIFSPISPRICLDNYRFSVIELLETKLKKSDLIVTENYRIHLRPKTARLLIEKIKNNINKRYQFKNKQYTLDNILYENVRTLNNYISGKSKVSDFNIPEMSIERVDNKGIRSKIVSIDPQKRKRARNKQIYPLVSTKED